MKRLLSIAVLGVMAMGLALPAMAKDDAGKDDSTRVVCKRIKETGTHFRRKVCLTKQRWDKMQEDAQKDMRDGLLPEAASAVPT